MNFGDARLPERFWSKVAPEPNSGCWFFVGAHTSAGYGNVGGKGWNMLAHRMAYEALVGPIPIGLVLDHKVCQTPCCVNPVHLEAVTHRINVLRGTAPPALHARATSCPQGHQYDTANTYQRKNTGRQCRACDRAYHAKKRSAA